MCVANDGKMPWRKFFVEFPPANHFLHRLELVVQSISSLYVIIDPLFSTLLDQNRFLNAKLVKNPITSELDQTFFFLKPFYEEICKFQNFSAKIDECFSIFVKNLNRMVRFLDSPII